MTSKRKRLMDEVLDTERDYMDTLQLIIEHYLLPMQAQVPALFSTEDMAVVFCNLEEIHAFELKFLQSMEAAHARGRVYQVFAEHRADFRVYAGFCSNFRKAQERLKVMYGDQDRRQFFVNCMLRSGSELYLDHHLLSVVSRLCKYPLLLKGLCECTTGSELADVQKAADTVNAVVNEINEAKRQLENLERIDTWQASVEGWTGPNLRDTSHELLHYGKLRKYTVAQGGKARSAVRWFFLFDNVLIYCKSGKSTSHDAAAAAGERSGSSAKGVLTFKGRINTQHMTLVDIEQGSSHVETQGRTVQHAFRINSTARNKWYILEAADVEDKQEWMQALQTEQLRQQRLNASVRIEDAVVIAGMALYEALSKKADGGEDPDAVSGSSSAEVIGTHKSFEKSMLGRNLCTWLVDNEFDDIRTREEAVRFGQALIDSGLVHHVHDKLGFEDSDALYCFRMDDDTMNVFLGNQFFSNISARGVNIYRRLHSDRRNSMITDHTFRMRAFHKSFVGSDFVQWLLQEGEVRTSSEAVALGNALLNANFIHHVTDDHTFHNKYLFYSFRSDEEVAPDPQTSLSLVKRVDEDDPLPQSFKIERGQSGFGLTISGHQPSWVRSVDPGSPAERSGIKPGHCLLSIDGIPASDLQKSRVIGLMKDKPSVALSAVSSGAYRALVRAQLIRSDGELEGEVGSKWAVRVGQFMSQNSVHAIDRLFGRDALFSFSAAGKPVHVRETLEYRPYAFTVPIAMLNLLVDEDNLLRASLSTPLTGLMEDCRISLLTKLNNRIKHYKASIAYLRDSVLLCNDNASFQHKKSVEKDAAPLEFVPTNLATMTMEVSSTTRPPSLYTVTTCGAASAYAIGYDHGAMSWQGLGPAVSPKHLELQGIMDLAKRITRANATLQSILPPRCKANTSYVAQDVRELTVDADTELLVARESFQQNMCQVIDEKRRVRSYVPCSILSRFGTLQWAQVPGFVALAQAMQADACAAFARFDELCSSRTTSVSSSGAASRVSRSSSESSLASPGPWQLALQSRTAKTLAATLLQLPLSIHRLQSLIDANSADPASEVHPEVMQQIDAVKGLSGSVHVYTHSLIRQIKAAVLLEDATMAQRFEAPQLAPTFNRELGLEHRFDVLRCQIIATFVNALCSKVQIEQRLHRTLDQGAMSPWLTAVESCGFCVHVESLLSTAGFETAMLADLRYAVNWLSTVAIVFLKGDADHPHRSFDIDLDGGRNGLTVFVSLDAATFGMLPRKLKASMPVDVVPVLFSHGVNEQQSAANVVAGDSFQHAINADSSVVLASYARKYLAALAAADDANTSLRRHRSSLSSSTGVYLGTSSNETKTERITRLLHQLQQNTEKVGTDTDMAPAVYADVTTASQLSHEMDAIKITCCKSGKDRTAVTVTLEEVSTLTAEHRLAPQQFCAALDTMRKHGVRRSNVYDNTGQDAYAFNDDQVNNHLPHLLQPPAGTYNKDIAT